MSLASTHVWRPLLLLATTSCSIAFSGSPCRSSDEEPALQETVRRYALVVAALRRHHQQKGALPEALHALVPAYLKALPAPPDGVLVNYQGHEDDYTLRAAFATSCAHVCEKRFRSGWRCGSFE